MTDIIDRLENEEMYIDAIDDAIAEIKRLRSELNAAREEREQFGKVHKALHDSWMNLADEQARLRSALRLIANHTADHGTAFETVVKFAAATLGETS